MSTEISFMPGSGGNFLARCLSLNEQVDWLRPCRGLDRAGRWPYLTYEPMVGRNPFSANWVHWEALHETIRDDDRPHVIRLDHGQPVTDIKITTLSREEWQWSVRQAMWKNTSFVATHMLTGRQFNQEKVRVPCRNLWQFDLLDRSLTEIERYMGVPAADAECRRWQKRLWEEWCKTHAPQQMSTLFDKIWNGPTDEL